MCKGGMLKLLQIVINYQCFSLSYIYEMTQHNNKGAAMTTDMNTTATDSWFNQSQLIKLNCR